MDDPVDEQLKCQSLLPTALGWLSFSRGTVNELVSTDGCQNNSNNKLEAISHFGWSKEHVIMTDISRDVGISL